MRSTAYIEQGAKRSFAFTLEWPGLCRSGKGEEAALEALSLYVERYAPVARAAGQRFPLTPNVEWEIIGRSPTRSAGADFGAPTAIIEADAAPWRTGELAKYTALLRATWGYLDEVIAASPPELVKGPRGGGRDRDAIYSHVAAAEQGCAAKVGMRLRAPEDRAGALANREAWLAWCENGAVPGRPPRSEPWPARNALRRVMWHALDHAWEIADRRP